jgi:hypothetical protein
MALTDAPSLAATGDEGRMEAFASTTKPDEHVVDKNTIADVLSTTEAGSPRRRAVEDAEARERPLAP